MLLFIFKSQSFKNLGFLRTIYIYIYTPWNCPKFHSEFSIKFYLASLKAETWFSKCEFKVASSHLYILKVEMYH